MNFIQLAAIMLAGLAVAVADALIKKAAASGSFWLALKDPLIIAIIVLYLSQIVLFLYVFAMQWNLGIVGNIQMVVYSLAVVLMGFAFFGERLSAIQLVGVALGIVGVILMNI